MADATVYIGKYFLNSEVRTQFLPELEKVLEKISGYKTSAKVANTNLTKPYIFITLGDFGNLGLNKVSDLMASARKLARQHFGFNDSQIEIEFSGKLTDVTTT